MRSKKTITGQFKRGAREVGGVLPNRKLFEAAIGHLVEHDYKERTPAVKRLETEWVRDSFL